MVWGRRAALVVVLALVLSDGMAAAKKPRPQACSRGTFLVEESSVLDADVTADRRLLRIQDGRMTVGGACASAKVKLKATRKGTAVAASWKRCTGLTGGVTFKGSLDPTCRTLRGTLKAKKAKIRRTILASLELLRGQVRLMTTINVAEGARADILAQRAAIEAGGKTLAADGSTISSPFRGASGWLVVVGDQRVRTLPDGRFSIHVPPGGPPDVQLFHPRDDTEAVYTFPVSALVPPEAPPVPVDIELRVDGPCGMNDAANPDPTAHPPGCPAAQLAVVAPGHGITRDNPPGSPVVPGPLGVYPAGNQTQCLDYDGLDLSSIGFDRTGITGTLAAYTFSTCSKRIDEGCCGDELGSLWVSFKKVFGFKPVDCQKNHKGRYCQELERGDVTVQTPSVTVSFLNSGGFDRFESDDGDDSYPYAENIVDGDSTTKVTVHNNACYGSTNVTKYVEQLFGTLAGPGYDQKTVRHFEQSGGRFTYVTDRVLEYKAPKCPQDPQARDAYLFEADGGGVTLGFRVRCLTTTTTMQVTNPTGPRLVSGSQFTAVAAGTGICLDRITNGCLTNGGLCGALHLHALSSAGITIAGVGGPYPDPQMSGVHCGYGLVETDVPGCTPAQVPDCP